MASYLNFWYSEEDDKKYGYDLVKDNYGNWVKYTLASESSYDYSNIDPNSILVYTGTLQDSDIKYVKNKRKTKNSNTIKNAKNVHFELEDLSIIAIKLTNLLTKTTSFEDLKVMNVYEIQQELDLLIKKIDECLKKNDKEKFTKLSKRLYQIKQML